LAMDRTDTATAMQKDTAADTTHADTTTRKCHASRNHQGSNNHRRPQRNARKHQPRHCNKHIHRRGHNDTADKCRRNHRHATYTKTPPDAPLSSSLLPGTPAPSCPKPQQTRGPQTTLAPCKRRRRLSAQERDAGYRPPQAAHRPLPWRLAAAVRRKLGIHTTTPRKRRP
jgi:hypothetical protein